MALAVVATVVLQACKPAPDKAPAVAGAASAPAQLVEPVVDASTPDRALKSFWAALDVREAAQHKRLSDLFAAESTLPGMTALKKLAVPGVAAQSPQDVLHLFSRDIEEVKVESESRAVALVTIKNVTPIPATADMSALPESLRKEREAGDKYKYILEREPNGGWRVAEIWTWWSYKKSWDKSRPLDGRGMPPFMTSSGAFPI